MGEDQNTRYFAYEEVLAIIRHGKGKGKAVPLQAWSGPEGFRK